MTDFTKELHKLYPRVPRRPHFFGSGKRRRNRHVYQEPEPAKPVSVGSRYQWEALRTTSAKRTD